MNQVELIGSFTKEFVFSHEIRNKSFYISEIAIPRTSGYIDVIPVIVEEPPKSVDVRTRFYLYGSFRVFNKHGVSFKYVYPECVYPVHEPFQNEIELEGLLYNVVHRKTPSGKQITDAMIRVERSNTSDSIPLIFWNGLGNDLKNDDKIHVRGRIQSRMYEKGGVYRTITEVSISKIL